MRIISVLHTQQQELKMSNPIKPGSILIVDDNRNVLTALQMLLQDEFEHIETTSNPNTIPQVIQQGHISCVLLDMNYTAGQQSGKEGLTWLQRIKEMSPTTSVVLFTAFGDVNLAVEALKMGATDFVLKPWDNSKLIATLWAAVQLSLSQSQVQHLTQSRQTLSESIASKSNIVTGTSATFAHVLELASKVAPTSANVLITGENGTGKEVIAREIHRLSARANMPMIPVDMGAIPETLFESELFGHCKGAFTDARTDRMGKFEAANGGTLFLDEIGNLPLSLQPKLLSAIQNRVITRLGSNKPIPVDVRLITATNSNLSQLVEQGAFREDLFFRLNTIQIEAPPLRERAEDIPVLAAHFAELYAQRYGKPCSTITDKALTKLSKYHWPGNIRELQHTVERAVILCDSKHLTPENFIVQPQKSDCSKVLPETLDEMERLMITQAIERHKGNYSAAATQLGITRQTLYNKMKRYHI